MQQAKSAHQTILPIVSLIRISN
uniref:Uncharacterized protein n=1 Tax=Arundo donax TaxID=35708 RepID=A0A0A8XU62_ARUDO